MTGNVNYYFIRSKPMMIAGGFVGVIVLNELRRLFTSEKVEDLSETNKNLNKKKK